MRRSCIAIITQPSLRKYAAIAGRDVRFKGDNVLRTVAMRRDSGASLSLTRRRLALAFATRDDGRRLRRSPTYDTSGAPLLRQILHRRVQR